VGWFANRRAERAREEYQGELAAWTEEDAHLRELLKEARSFDGDAAPEGLIVQLHKDERVYLIGRDCPLVEPRRGPGQYRGGYQGVSIPIGNSGLRYRVGAGRGQVVPGAEKPTAIDTGTVTITSQRVVFQGPMQTREWAFSKLIGYQHFDAPHWTALQVSNRQKTSGIAYDAASAMDVQFRLELALAHFNDRVGQLIGQLEAEISSHDAHRPIDPALAGAPKP
jgi:hypothetical protein